MQLSRQLLDLVLAPQALPENLLPVLLEPLGLKGIPLRLTRRRKQDQRRAFGAPDGTS